jgi:hypothetical protein
MLTSSAWAIISIFPFNSQIQSIGETIGNDFMWKAIKYLSLFLSVFFHKEGSQEFTLLTKLSKIFSRIFYFYTESLLQFNLNNKLE